jgi:hypothetical protein
MPNEPTPEARVHNLNLKVTETEMRKARHLAKARKVTDDRGQPAVSPLLRTMSLEQIIAEADDLLTDSAEILQATGS